VTSEVALLGKVVAGSNFRAGNGCFSEVEIAETSCLSPFFQR
jgi:hypothetical protein